MPSEAPQAQPIDQQRLNERLRRALATPPISNEEIERRSKDQRGKQPD
jgi:hypothetical protein